MSNETQWTPGPWTLKMRHRDSAIIETRDRTIASLMQYGDTDRAADANARLIAAAPEMAALLERYCGIRKPNVGKWTKAETERSLAALEAEARAFLARIKGPTHA